MQAEAGQDKKRSTTPKAIYSEHEECKLFLQLLPDRFRDLLIHVPNEGQRTLGYAKKLKAIGLKAGVSDYFLAVPTHKYAGLWIELKTKIGKPSQLQLDFIAKMKKAGYAAYVIHGGENAARLVKMYVLNKL